jgi:hypothetical protein
MIVKWEANEHGHVRRREFERESDHYLFLRGSAILASQQGGRRKAKQSSRTRYFDTRLQALRWVRDQAQRKLKSAAAQIAELDKAIRAEIDAPSE